MVDRPGRMPGTFVGPGKITPSLAASSLSVVEDFLGVDLTAGVALRAATMPRTQRLALAKRIEDFQHSAMHALASRVHPRRPDIDAAAAFGAHARAGGPVSSEPFPDDALFVEDATFFGSFPEAMATVSHVLLYCNRALWPDPTFVWANQAMIDDVDDPQDLQRCLEQLSVIAPAVRQGYLVPVPPPVILTIDETGLEHVSDLDALAPYLEDPVAAAALIQVAKFEDWEFAVRGLDPTQPDELLDAAHIIINDLHETPAWAPTVRKVQALLSSSSQRTDDWQQAMMTGALIRDAAVIPVSSAASTLRYLEQLTSVTNGQRLTGAPAAPAIHLRLPDLSSVGFGDLVRARAGEPLFAEIREGLKRSTEDASTAASGQSFMAYTQALQQAALDHLSPVASKIDKASRRTTGIAVLTKVSAKSIGLALRALGTVHGLPVGAVGGGATGGADALLGRKLRGRQARLETTRSVLVSLVGERDADVRYRFAP